MRTEPTRRVMLASAAAGSLLLAGCKGLRVLGPLPRLAPDVVTLRQAISAEEVMVARYEAAQARLSALAGEARAMTVAASLLAEHQAHLARLRALLILPPGHTTARPSPRPAQPAMPAGWHAVLRTLAAAEQAASDRLLRQLAGTPPALAQLMASIAASEAAHVVVLGTVVGGAQGNGGQGKGGQG